VDSLICGLVPCSVPRLSFLCGPAEESSTLLFLAQFQTASVDQQIIDKAGEFYRKWNPISGTDINDAILAANALRAGGKIYTLNLEHYPMPDVTVQRAWKT
jgi:predicted nucleic acid-binding protein